MKTIVPEEERIRIDRLIDEILEVAVSISPTAEEYVFHIQTKEGKDLVAECNEILTDAGIAFYEGFSDKVEDFALLRIEPDKTVHYWSESANKKQLDPVEVVFTSAKDLEIIKQVFIDEIADNL